MQESFCCCRSAIRAIVIHSVSAEVIDCVWNRWLTHITARHPIHFERFFFSFFFWFNKIWINFFAAVISAVVVASFKWTWVDNMNESRSLWIMNERCVRVGGTNNDDVRNFGRKRKKNGRELVFFGIKWNEKLFQFHPNSNSDSDSRTLLAITRPMQWIFLFFAWFGVHPGK